MSVPVAPLLGLGEWFRPGEYDRAEHAIDDLRALGVTHLRMGVSGDRRYYVSDTSKFTAATGWRPAVSAADGVCQLAEWLVRSGRVAADGAAARLLAS